MSNYEQKYRLLRRRLLFGSQFSILTAVIFVSFSVGILYARDNSIANIESIQVGNITRVERASQGSLDFSVSAKINNRIETFTTKQDLSNGSRVSLIIYSDSVRVLPQVFPPRAWVDFVDVSGGQARPLTSNRPQNAFEQIVLITSSVAGLVGMVAIQMKRDKQ